MSRTQIKVGLIVLLVIAICMALPKISRHVPHDAGTAAQIHVDHDHIRIDPRATIGNDLKIEAVKLAPSSHEHEVPAFVKAEVRRTIDIFPPVSGRIVETNLLLGEKVTKGQILAVMESSDFTQALTDYRNAVAQETFQKSVVARAKNVLQIGGNAAKDLDAARFALTQAQSERQRADKRLEALGITPDQVRSSSIKIVSPIDGFVQKSLFANGKNVTDTTISQATLIDLSSVQVEAYVPEDSAGVIKVGLPMIVTFDDLPGRHCDGKVERIDPELQDDIRRIVARMTCPNPDLVLRPNMFAHARIDVPLPSMVLIPKSAIVMDNDHLVVFKQTGINEFVRCVVKVSFDESDDVRVYKGLSQGDRVVTQGAILLNDAL